MSEPAIRTFVPSDRLSPEQRALIQKRDSMILSRKRVLHDLESSHSLIYRKNLEAGLAFLDQQIEEVDRTLAQAPKAEPTRPPGRLPVRRRK